MENKLNCFSSEFLQAYFHIWEVKSYLKCDSPYSPTKSSQVTYSLQPFSMMPLDAQLNEHFPDNGDRILEYCSAEFKETPPSHAPTTINSRENIDFNEKNSFYECRGKPNQLWKIVSF